MLQLRFSSMGVLRSASGSLLWLEMMVATIETLDRKDRVVPKTLAMESLSYF